MCGLHRVSGVFAVLAFVVLSAVSASNTSSAAGRCGGHRACLPAVINTWGFTRAAEEAWRSLHDGDGAITAVEVGCHVCEEDRCDGTVGWGGSPDTNGESTLDAMIMDGTTMNVGSVAALRRVKNAIGVARKILEHTDHTMLVGEQATQFAVENFGFAEESLTSPESARLHADWLAAGCQPNFFRDLPNSTSACPPYHGSIAHDSAPNQTKHDDASDRKKYQFGPGHHDTIGMVAVDSSGHIVCGTSTNGARHKIAGRVGDSPITGSGAYCDDAVGGAAATGDGDIMMRFLPSFLTVELMRGGAEPTQAAEQSIRRILSHYPDFSGSIVALRKDGEWGAATHGYTFPVSVASPRFDGVRVVDYPPVQ